MKREINKRSICEYRCDERLKSKSEGSTRCGYTNIYVGVGVLSFLFIIERKSESYREDLHKSVGVMKD